MLKHGMTKIALAAVLTIGAASFAFAEVDNTEPSGGYRELGPGGVVTDGVNPAYHRSLRGGNAYGYAPNSATPSKIKSKTKTHTTSN